MNIAVFSTETGEYLYTVEAVGAHVGETPRISKGFYLCAADDLGGDPSCYHYDTGLSLSANPPKSPGALWDSQLKCWKADTAALEAAATSDALHTRGVLLRQSDWTQLPDVPLATKNAWAAYRQALRDITDQPGYPINITWPTPPN